MSAAEYICTGSDTIIENLTLRVADGYSVEIVGNSADNTIALEGGA